jgi:hypothetical protein
LPKKAVPNNGGWANRFLQIHRCETSKNLAERPFIPLKDAVRQGLTWNSPRSTSLGDRKRNFWARLFGRDKGFLGATRAMAMTIGCDFRAITGEPQACAGAALILGGLLLLIAP